MVSTLGASITVGHARVWAEDTTEKLKLLRFNVCQRVIDPVDKIQQKTKDKDTITSLRWVMETNMVAKKGMGARTKKRDSEGDGSGESHHSHTSELVLSMGTQSDAVSGRLKSSKSRKPVGRILTSEEIQGMLNLNPKTNDGADGNLEHGLRRIETGVWTKQ